MPTANKARTDQLSLAIDAPQGACARFILPVNAVTPAEVLTVFFDGGAKPRWNDEPALVYGSFKVMEWTDKPAERREFEGFKTSNEAEFLTAIQALRFLALHHAHPAQLQVRLRGDSMLAVNCLSGLWKIKKDRLQALAKTFHEVAAQFHSVTLSWHRRNHSVEVLGH